MITFVTVLVISGGLAFTQEKGNFESPKERDARMAWWREARFGMFVHWGLFSAAGGVWEGRESPPSACWMQSKFQIPPDTYASLTRQFTGEHFDAAFIARLAREAGMKYIVPVAKHHEGFCLFDSSLTDFKIANTPARSDWIRQLLDAARAEGLHTGIYYSLLDWHHPDYSVDKFHPMRGDSKFAARPREWENYLRYMHGQIEELMTGYGRIDIFWPDFSYGEMRGEKWKSAELTAMIRQHQPQIIINNRLEDLKNKDTVNPLWGMDFQTPEQKIPPTGIPGKDWETCQTINGTWEYTHFDRNWKSPTELIHQLIDTVSKGGNYLLNIGPKPDGTVPQSTVDILHAIGGWMKVNGESIYGTAANPFPAGVPWGRCTLKHLPDGNTRLYFHIFKWPWNARLQIPPLENEITSVWLLSDPAHPKLTFNREADGGTVVELPVAETNDYATVVAVNLRGDVRFGESTKVKASSGLHVSTSAVEVADLSNGKDGTIGGWTGTHDLQKLSDNKWKTTGGDPYLLSGPMGSIPTEGRQFEIRMKISGPPDMAELRWWSKGGGPDMDHTLRFSPVCDGQWHTYTIDPSAQFAEWGSPIDTVRVDPSVNTGSEIEIESVELVPVDGEKTVHTATLQLDRKFPYAGQPIRFLMYYPRPWTGELPRPMFTYAVSDETGKQVRSGVMLGMTAYNMPYPMVAGGEAIDGLPAGRYSLGLKLRNDKNPAKPVTGTLKFEVLDPGQRHVLTLPWQYVKDYTVVRADDGLFHAFGLVGRADRRQDWAEERLQNEKQFFHATSSDLVNWTQHADVLHCPESGYDDRGVWSPYVFKHGSQYWMFYTGTQKGVVQRLCAATSPDLFTWTRLPENPLMSADKTDWAAARENGWTDYRDPMIFHDEVNRRWIAYNAAKTKEGKGRIAAAVSDDLIHWKDAGPVEFAAYNDRPFGIGESPFVWKMGGRYYLSVNHSFGICAGDSPLGPFNTKLDPNPMPPNVMAHEILNVGPNLWLVSGFSWEMNGNYVEFFAMSLKDGKPVVSRDLSEILNRK